MNHGLQPPTPREKVTLNSSAEKARIGPMAWDHLMRQTHGIISLVRQTPGWSEIDSGWSFKYGKAVWIIINHGFCHQFGWYSWYWWLSVLGVSYLMNNKFGCVLEWRYPQLTEAFPLKLIPSRKFWGTSMAIPAIPKYQVAFRRFRLYKTTHFTCIDSMLKPWGPSNDQVLRRGRIFSHVQHSAGDHWNDWSATRRSQQDLSRVLERKLILVAIGSLTGQCAQFVMANQKQHLYSL